ncbi:Uncharacterised protein [Pannonibacter phragmitetus]|uniref:Uncharacterized protein n=1 Tax=Pannonibacter phragmitetus TaxID=121719 RepID=A0A378ZXU5_9HYPH|nr:hypothetical protein [Pannonibacter phragmitetus]SUB01898.1 Uncharacterised protein [Pannonibacter phragmitetus]
MKPLRLTGILWLAMLMILTAANPLLAQDLPPRSDSWFTNSQFLACTGNPYAMCFYSGPDAPTPSDPSQSVPALPCTTPGDRKGNSTCTCYAVTEEAKGTPQYNFVLITSILNPKVHEETVAACGETGENCLNGDNLKTCMSGIKAGFCQTAPVCGYLGSIADGTKPTLYPDNPDVDMVSTFSLAHATQHPLTGDGESCSGLYAGCMTAPCKTDENGLTSCSCPIVEGDYQVGMNFSDLKGLSCDISPNVWSAANKLDLHISSGN